HYVDLLLFVFLLVIFIIFENKGTGKLNNCGICAKAEISGGASFPWGARRAGARANLRHCNRQTHQERVGKRSRMGGARGLPKVEEVVSLALSLPPFVYMLSTTGGGRGHADAGGGGVALQLCKLPFHSHKALPGGGGCPRLQNSSSHQLTDTRGCTQRGGCKAGKPGARSSRPFRPPGLPPVHSADQLRAERCNATPTLRAWQLLGVKKKNFRRAPGPPPRLRVCAAEREADVQPGRAGGEGGVLLVCDLGREAGPGVHSGRERTRPFKNETAGGDTSRRPRRKRSRGAWSRGSNRGHGQPSRRAVNPSSPPRGGCRLASASEGDGREAPEAVPTDSQQLFDCGYSKYPKICVVCETPVDSSIIASRQGLEIHDSPLSSNLNYTSEIDRINATCQLYSWHSGQGNQMVLKTQGVEGKKKNDGQMKDMVAIHSLNKNSDSNSWPPQQAAKGFPTLFCTMPVQEASERKEKGDNVY
ncbi:hypothetical protein EI555_012694, partial [Monodon monoceros]